MRTIVAQVLVKKDDKILMVKENKKEKKGKWNMPAGKLEDCESIIDAAIRETREETGIEVEITGLIAIQQNISLIGQLVIFYFVGEYISGSIKYNKEEIADVKWLTLNEINNIKNDVRGAETIDDVLMLSEEKAIPLDRIKIESFL